MKLVLAAACCATACGTQAERAAKALAGRVAPGYRIAFREVKDSVERYAFFADKEKVVIEGTSANAMAAGLGRYLRDCCHTDVSWYDTDPVTLPEVMPLPDSAITCRALVPKRFFLNYCTFGYSLPWWKWEQWERLIDWMALNGVNLPLAITGQESVWQEVWRRHGLTDDEIRAWFTGPAHLPWHRMCNIDSVDGPLPQGWIDAQEQLQKRILSRERELGMRPVLPAFAGHVPGRLKELYPSAGITDIAGWGGFGPENLPHFLSPEDSLYAVIQREFLEIQTQKYGTDHIYGFDLFNEVDPPSWDPETLAAYGLMAYQSVTDVDPDAEWLQMGWMFHYDRKHWTPENVRAYLTAIPQGRVTLLDYYTEHTPVWTLTEGFYGQPYVFCYLGNFGGNTRLAGPFRKESSRISEALETGGASGIGCTLEGFGVNRWFYEYVLARAWDTGVADNDWLASLDLLHGAPAGFWKDMADSVYLRGSFSEGPLLCDRPGLEGYHGWRVIYQTPYDPAVLERLWNRLRSCPGASRADVVALGCQVLGNRFAPLRDAFTAAYRAGDLPLATRLAAEMQSLLEDLDRLAGEEPQFRLDKWLADASSWAATPEEEAYYRHNAWHLITTWGTSPNLNDYASRVWSGLVSGYYAKRWKLFTDSVLAAMAQGIPFDAAAFDMACEALEKELVAQAAEPCAARELSVMTYNVGVFSKYGGSSLPDVAELIRESGASLVALNELDSCNRRHNSYQLAELARVLGSWDYHFAGAFPFADGSYGNGVVSRESVLWTGRVDLPRADGAEPRCAAVVETASCVLASVHLDHLGQEARLEQARALNDWFTAHYAGCRKPVLLCGDFNAVPGSPALSLLESCWERLSPAAVTHPEAEGGKCIDHVFALRAAAPVEVLSARVLSSAAGLSDHLPVLVTLRF